MFISDRKLILFIIITFFFLAHISIHSQSFQRVVDQPEVLGLSGYYNDPFSGGFNNIEHQFVDIDNDTDLDLIFLNSDGTFGWFENIGNSNNPQFAYRLDSLPGTFFSDWFFLIDIDSDEDFDLFTGDNGYIKLLRNTGGPFSPAYSVALDTLKDDIGNPIVSEFGSNPVFVDIDGDNDFDFLSGNSAGTVTFYENIGTPGQFIFKFITNVWQNILIIGGGLDDPRHGSSSLDFADIDSDDDKDLIWGDFFSKSLYLIENKGTPIAPVMQVVSDVYPLNEDSVFTRGYNMPRFIDIDGDGLLDLFVSVLYDPTVSQSLMFFKNQGSSGNPDHRKITDDVIYTLDVGNNSHPALVDIDSDGDLDLFIGSLNNPMGFIYYFENNGSPQNPLFEFRTNSFADIQTDLSVVPAFCDIDDDDDYDLFIGKIDGRVLLYKNEGNKFNPDYVFYDELKDLNQNLIDVGSFSTPFFYDFDGDDDMDLILGAFDGRFYLYKNSGTAANYSFELIENYFLNLDVGDNSAPFIIDNSNNTYFELFSGNRNGRIFHYKNNGTISNPDWILETQKYLNQNFGGSSVPCFVDIDNDLDMDLILGNVKGGLYFYRNLSVNNISDEIKNPEKFSLIETYPNPFNPFVNVVVHNEKPGTVSLDIFNLLGEKVKNIFKGQLDAGKHLFGWDGTNDSYVSLPAGNYFILFITDETFSSSKITYLK